MLALACEPPEPKELEGGEEVAGESAGSEAGVTAGARAGTEAGTEAGELAGTEAGLEAGEPAGMEAGMEAGELAGVEAGELAGVEAGELAGVEAGELAGVEAGELAGMESGEPAGESAGEPAGEEAGMVVERDSCEAYCDQFTEACPDLASAMWGDDPIASVELCLDECNAFAADSGLGTPDEERGATVECLITYAERALDGTSGACVAAQLDAERPCFDYSADLTGGGRYEAQIGASERDRVMFTIAEASEVRLLATDGADCFDNDFNFTLFEVSDPLAPRLIAREDDFDLDNFDYCPLWIGSLEPGLYEVEVGTYQDLGAPDPLILTLEHVARITSGEVCLSPLNRPLAWCEEGVACLSGYCVEELNAGDPCVIEPEGAEPRCVEGTFCYQTLDELDGRDGRCEATPAARDALCAPALEHCPIETSCVARGGDYQCTGAECGDGVLNPDEECDDGNLEGGDGCDALCAYERRRAIAPYASSITMYGVLSANDSTWSRPNERCDSVDESGEFYVDTRTLVNETGTDQRISIEVSWGQDDGFLHLYRGDPDSGEVNLNLPLVNCEQGSDDGAAGASESALFEIPIAAGEVVTLTLSTFTPGDVVSAFEIIVYTHGCGDGRLQSGEACDDGNLIAGDGCSPECVFEPVCGDGVIDLEIGEVCDDGNTQGGDGCSELCQPEAILGRRIAVATPGMITDADSALLEDAPQWHRRGTLADLCAELSGREQYAFNYFILENTTGFDQVIDLDLIPSTELDDFVLHVYREPFEPTESSGCITGADGGGERFNDDRIEGYEIAAGDSVAVIVSAYDDVDSGFGYPGSYQLQITTREPPLVDACALLEPRLTAAVEGESVSVMSVVSAVGYTDLSAGVDQALFVEVGVGPAEVNPEQDASLSPETRQWSWGALSADLTWLDDQDAWAGDWVGYDAYRGELITPNAGEWAVATRASLGGQRWRYCDLGPTEGYQPLEAGQLTALPFTEPRLLINEIDYDQDGVDNSEFIELYNPGPARVPLSGVTLELVDGASGNVYLNLDLSDVAEHLNAGVYLVIGSPLVTDLMPAEVLTLPLPIGIQNGGATPDALRVINAEGVIFDGLSYEGGGVAVEGYTEGTGQATGDSSSAPGSLSRCPSGEDSDDNSLDFASVGQSTPGAVNICP